NNNADGSGCTADANECTDDVCAAGACTHPNKGAGATCGSSATSDCDAADSCDGSGACLPNNHANGSGCTADSNECTDDVCSGGTCTHPNKGAGATCGS